MSSTYLSHYTDRYPGSGLGGIGIQTAGRQQKVERDLKRMTEGMSSSCGRRGGRGVQMEGKCQGKGL